MSIYDDPVLEVGPDPEGWDPDAFVEQTAANAAASVAPPYPVNPLWRAPAEELNTEDGWESDSDVPMPAGPPLLSAPPRTVITEAEEEVAEAAVFKTDLHPRWPKGSGKKAGEFMRVGETFMSDGKRWQIAHIVKGRIYAHEASGDYKSTETRAFDTEHNDAVGGHVVPGIAQVDTTVPQGGKSQSSNVPVVNPYVDHASHDPSIPIPEHSQLTEAQWARFGKVDQEHYTELMERFGKHKPGAAKTHVDKVYAEYSAKAGQLVKSAYSSQYGSSSGYTLSLAAGGHGSWQDTPEMRKLREECLALQAEHKAAVQWDLYNRCKAPDVLAVHKSKSWSAQKWHDHAIGGNNKVFSGLSQSFCYRRNFFGQQGVVTPLAIRHVLLSSASAQPIPGSTHFPGELEISVAEQMALDDRSFVVANSGSHALTGSQQSWLEGMTNQPVGGQIVDQLRDSIKTGTYLPPPPKPAHVVMDGANGKTWVDPPAEMAKDPGFAAGELPAVSGGAIDAATLPQDLPWQHTSDAGVPEAKTGEEAGAKQGQYFMGLKGTLYYIGHDPGNKTGYPFRIHKIVDGAFNGENFQYNPDLPGYYLDAQKEHKLPTGDEAGGPVWEPHKWVQGTETKFLDQFQAGDKFKLEGTAYEVTGTAPGGKVSIMDLESGLTGQINGDYKSNWLVPHDGAPLTADQVLASPELKVGDHVVYGDAGMIPGDSFKGVVDAVNEDGVHITPMYPGAAQTTVGEFEVTKVPKQAPKVGMTFPMRRPEDPPGSPKVKATVTKVLADGSVQVNLKPGKVVIAADEWPTAEYSLNAYDPNAHVIGDKAKLRDLAPGDKFHGSAGNQTHRPYEVIRQLPTGKKQTVVRNLDTGEVSVLSAHKSYPTLDAKAADVPMAGATHATPVEATPGNVGVDYDPAAFEVAGGKAYIPNMPVGQHWQTPGGAVMKKIAHTDEGSEVMVVHGVSVGGMEPGESVLIHHDVAGPETNAPLQTLLMPKAESDWSKPGKIMQFDAAGNQVPVDGVMPDSGPATGFDPGKFVEGDQLKVGQMRPGTIFKTNSKSGPKYYQLSDDGSHTTNLQTGKVYEVKPHYKATPLKQASGAPGKPLSEQFPKGTIAILDPKTKDVGIDHGEVLGHENGLVQIQGHTGTVNVGAHEISHVEDPGNFAEAELANAEVAHGELMHELDGLAENQTHVLPNGTKVHKVPAGFRLEHASGDLGPVHHSSSAAAGAALYMDAVTQIHAGNKHTESGLGSNAKGKKLGDLAPGAVFSPAPGGIQYKIVDTATGDDVVHAEAVSGPDVGESLPFGVNVVPADLHSEPLTQAHVGQMVTAHPNPNAPASQQMPHAKTGYVKKVRESDGAVQLHGSVMWHKPEHVTVHDEHLPPFKGGDQVQLESGEHGTFMGWDTHPNGEPGALVDTTGNMDTVMVSPDMITAVAEGSGFEQEGVPLTSKAQVPTPHEQLVKGDATTLGTLKPGDQFKLDDGVDTWQMVSQPAAGASPEDSYAHVAVVHADGSLGGSFDAGLHPGHSVTFHAKAEDTTPVPVPDALPTEVYADAVTHGGLTPFAEPKGGPWVHSQIGAMPEGTVFEDAAGNVWKVKQAGPTPTISGGAVHYSVDGALRGKDLSQPNTPAPQHVDTAGPLGGGEDADAEAAAAAMDLVTNHSGLPLDQLVMKQGDYVQLGNDGGIGSGDLAVFHGVNAEGDVYAFKHPSNGASTFKGSGHVPLSVSPGAFVEAPVMAGGGGHAPHSLYTEQTTAGQLAQGQKFTMAPNSTMVHTASTTGGPGEGVGFTADDGSTGFHPGSGPVYVMPDESPGKPSLPEPAAPTAEPAELPPVEGPKGFAPAAAKPVLDPNFSPLSTLDPFTSRKGPGGIYSYPRLSETQPGQVFTDKSGKDLRVVDHGSAKTVYEDMATGVQYSAPSTARVKLTALPPDPGPQLAPVITDLTAKHGSLENVPKLGLDGHTSTYASDGKTKNPRLGHLKFGDVAYDANGYGVTFLGSWLDRALVLDHTSNEVRLADAGTRVSKQQY